MLRRVKRLVVISGELRKFHQVFELEGAENISAILFSPSSDIDKFNRMGLKDGFNNNKYKIRRTVKSPNINTWAIEHITKIIPTKNTLRLGVKV